MIQAQSRVVVRFLRVTLQRVHYHPNVQDVSIGTVDFSTVLTFATKKALMGIFVRNADQLKEEE